MGNMLNQDGEPVQECEYSDVADASNDPHPTANCAHLLSFVKQTDLAQASGAPVIWVRSSGCGLSLSLGKFSVGPESSGT